MLDLAHHPHVASKTFYANRPYLLNMSDATQDRFPHFNAMVKSGACFGATQKIIVRNFFLIENVVCGPLAAVIEICNQCFQCVKKLSCESIEMVPTKRLTTSPPCLQLKSQIQKLCGQ